MTTITEDYVSFETAKLLKEKGFNIPTRAFYNPKKDYMLRINSCEIDRNVGVWASAPTFQMAMKWLRKVHNIVIEIKVDHHFRIFDGYSAAFVKIDGDVSFDYYLLNNKRTYEETVEAAIKYCLENLI